MKLFNKLLTPLIPVIHIKGTIGPKTVENLTSQLQSVNYSRAKALAVYVNSIGGIPISCDQICHKLLHYSRHHHLPLYTFAGDYATSGGYWILSIGDKVFADSTSLIGSIGVLNVHVNLRRILEKQGIQYRKFTSNKNMLSATNNNFFEPYNEQSFQQLEPFTNEIYEEFKSHVNRFRGTKINKLSNEETIKLIYEAQIFTGVEAQKNGLIDQTGELQIILKKSHPECQIKHILSKPFYQVINESMTFLITPQ